MVQIHACPPAQGLQRWSANGLSLMPSDFPRALRALGLSVGGVTLLIIALDGLLFRQQLPADYVALYTDPLWPRTAIAMLRSLGDEVLFRLLVMTSFVFVLKRATSLSPAGIATIAIALAQFVAVFGLFAQAPLYVLLRFWLVGCVWGWLYWRHGWLTASVAHPLTHLVMDPLLRATLLAT